MNRYIKAMSKLQLSPFRGDLPTSFREVYASVCRIRFNLNYAENFEFDLTEEDAAHLTEMLTRAEERAVEQARRRHELKVLMVNRVSVVGVLAVVAEAFLRLVAQ